MPLVFQLTTCCVDKTIRVEVWRLLACRVEQHQHWSDATAVIVMNGISRHCDLITPVFCRIKRCDLVLPCVFICRRRRFDFSRIQSNLIGLHVNHVNNLRTFASAHPIVAFRTQEVLMDSTNPITPPRAAGKKAEAPGTPEQDPDLHVRAACGRCTWSWGSEVLRHRVIDTDHH